MPQPLEFYEPPNDLVKYKAAWSLAIALAMFAGMSRPAFAQSPTVSLSTSGLSFGSQNIGTSSPQQTITLTNTGSASLTITGIVLTGSFYGDFAETGTCGATVAAGAGCTISIRFSPTGTGLRAATLQVFDNAGNSPQTVALNGTGAGTCVNVSDCAFQVLNQRVTANRASFFVFKDADSPFNHGFPSGLFGTIDLKTVTLDSACIDDPASSTGCSTDQTRLDATRGTVFRFTYPPLPGITYVGLNFQDPEHYNPDTMVGNGYNLNPAATIQFDARSPNGANVQFGVGGCVTGFYALARSWTTITISLVDLFPSPGGSSQACPPDLTNTHILFAVSTNAAMSPGGGTVLLDNIQFTPVPARQTTDAGALSLPLGNLTFGTVPQPIVTSDQANRNLAPIYEASITALSLLKRGQPGDVLNAIEIVDTFDYALHHENHGVPLPVAHDGSVALHSAYQGGDIALLNGQDGTSGPQAQAGDVRLAGFSGDKSLCGSNGFCLVLDGATGGNNAFAILALAAAYLQSGKPVYLQDAEMVGNWIADILTDTSASGSGGYFAGINNSGDPGGAGTLNCGKSTENNADIFGAFSLLAQIESTRGNASAAAQWVNRAHVGGEFVISMFDQTKGHFNVGTIPSDPQACKLGVPRHDSDIVNTADFLDSDTFSVLPMAGSALYKNRIDWRRPVQYDLNHFAESVTVGSQTFSGFDIVMSPTTRTDGVPAANGVAWEFTGQAVEAMRYVDQLYKQSTFEGQADSTLSEIRHAQASAPFGDGFGVPASTLQNGSAIPPVQQCLNTPFQCIPERVGLAAANWAIYADLKFNPLAFAALVPFQSKAAFAGQLLGTSSSAMTITLTSLGTAPVIVNGPPSVIGNSGDFVESDDCLARSPIAPGDSCTVTVAFKPIAADARSATVQIGDNALGSPQTIFLTGTGLPLNDFMLRVMPSPQSVVAGNAASYTVTASLVRGAAQSVALSCTAPAGLSCAFNPPSISSDGGSATLTITSSLTIAPGPYMVTVTGTGAFAIRFAPAGINVAGPTNLSPTKLGFGSQTIGTTSAAQVVKLTNNGPVTLNIVNIAIAGSFSGDFTETSACGSSLSPGASCNIGVMFSPAGTGARNATLLVFSTGDDSPQPVALSGTGVGSCSGIASCGLQLFNQRVSANQNNFFVYKDADSGLNHGLPSGLFGNPGFDPMSVTIDSACVDDPTSPTGCAPGHATFDAARGTVLRIVFPPLPNAGQFIGLNFQDPEHYDGKTVVGIGYDLTPATAVQFDIRSPDGAKVQFGVGGCVSGFYAITPSWLRQSIAINTLVPPPPTPGMQPVTCPPNIHDTHLLFTVVTNTENEPGGGTVLLDNIQFTPVPAIQTTTLAALSFPLSSQVFGVASQPHLPISSDQVNRNLTTTYESALTLIALLKSFNPADVAGALKIANAFHYALYNDNHGDPIPAAPGMVNGCYSGIVASQCGLHSAYINGDVAFHNNQDPPKLGQAGDIRLAGFSSGTFLCGASGFCLVLDGASGGSNAWAIMALLAAHLQTHDTTYLNDAVAIANWIFANLTDTSGTGYGGYFVGYTDGGLPRQLILGKSTRFNAEIFAAFTRLAQVESGLGNSAASTQWTTRANVAGDFVMQMFDSTNGRFYSGTVIGSTTNATPGICPAASTKRGNDIINTCDSLDSDTIAALALVPAGRYAVQIDWRRPLQYAQGHFTQSVSAGGQSYSGFNLVIPNANSNGVAWEFTGQSALAMEVVDKAQFAGSIAFYLNQIQRAHLSGPFGDGLGIVGSTLPNGDLLNLFRQCLITPFQCVAERVGLASTAWAVLGSMGVNPLSALSVATLPVLSVNKSHTGNFTPGQQNAGYTVKVSNIGSLPTSGMVTVTESVPPGMTLVSMSGAGWTCLSNSNTCSRSDVLAAGGDYSPITVTVNIAVNVPSTLVNQVGVSGGGSASANASDPTTILATLFLSPKSLNFGFNGTLVTGPQTVTLTFTGTSGVSWTASSNQPNITVTPTSGKDSATITVTTVAGASGIVTITAPDASNSPQTIPVNVTGAAIGPPFGSFDTPIDNTAGISGAIAVTGWALDSIEVTNVDIWREPVANESTASNGLVFIGNAVFVAGQRTDVESLYPNFPFHYRAGWGYQLLTNLLPHSGGSPGPGNGAYKLHAIAHNKAGIAFDLGTRTIVVDNFHAAKPFGTIDTPGQGETVSGNQFVNFAWVLTQNPYCIPTDGSTITVTVDGVTLGHATYNQLRSDIANLFPGLCNSNGAVGYFYIDTTKLSNGVHTIAWVAFDNRPQGEGIGSRYFNVLNGAAGPAAQPEEMVQPASRDRLSIRRGYDRPDEWLAPEPEGSYSVEVAELDRLELRLGAPSGYLMVNREPRPLPVGSTLKGGVFYWQLGPGFYGKYSLMFDLPDGTKVQVEVVVRPKGLVKQRAN